MGRYKHKEDDTVDANIKWRALIREVVEHESRIEKIAEYIVHDYNRKTKNRRFNAILAVGSTDAARKYYQIFKTKA